MFESSIDDFLYNMTNSDYYKDWPDELLQEELQFMTIFSNKINSGDCFSVSNHQKYVF